MPPGTHAKLGASKTERWWNCPGSPRMEAGREDTPTEYALEGTAAHELAEDCLRNGGSAHDRVGTNITVEKDGMKKPLVVPVSMEMCDAVQVYVDHCRSLIHDGGTAMVEKRFDLSILRPPGDEPMFGTCDFLFYDQNDHVLHVVDYKHGAGVAVDVEENKQLMYYALGAVATLKIKPLEIRMTIVQPRSFHPQGVVRTWAFNWHDLIAFKKELWAAVARTLDRYAPLKPGPHCRFCKALPTCPAQMALARKVAQDEFAEPDPNEVRPVLPGPESLDNDQLLLVAERGDDVIAWIKSVYGYIQSAMERGEKFPGWKLVEGRRTRQWADEEAALKFLKNKRLRVDDIYNRKLVSPAQAEKALKRNGHKPRLKKGLVVMPQGAPKLVRDTDHGEPLDLSASSEFAALPAPSPMNEPETNESQTEE